MPRVADITQVATHDASERQDTHRLQNWILQEPRIFAQTGVACYTSTQISDHTTDDHEQHSISTDIERRGIDTPPKPSYARITHTRTRPRILLRHDQLQRRSSLRHLRATRHDPSLPQPNPPNRRASRQLSMVPHLLHQRNLPRHQQPRLLRSDNPPYGPMALWLTHNKSSDFYHTWPNVYLGAPVRGDESLKAQPQHIFLGPLWQHRTDFSPPQKDTPSRCIVTFSFSAH